MHSTCVWRFGDLKEDGASLQVSDLKAHKVDVVNVVLGFTQVSCNNDRQVMRNWIFKPKLKRAALTCTKVTCKNSVLDFALLMNGHTHVTMEQDEALMISVGAAPSYTRKYEANNTVTVTNENNRGI